MTELEQRRADKARATQDARNAANVARNAANAAARIEDVTWMARWGETTDGASERLGLTREGLRKSLVDRWHRGDLWEQLRLNEISRFGDTLDRIRCAQAAHMQKQWGVGRPGRTKRGEVA